MKNSKYLVAGVAVVAVGLGWFALQPAAKAPQASPVSEPLAATQPTASKATPVSFDTPSKPASTVVQTTPATQDVAEKYPEIAERFEAMQQRRPNRNFDPEAVAAAVKRETAWTPAEEPPEDLPLKEEEMTDGRQFIQLDSLKIETLMPGDSVTVAIEETGEQYNVVMDRVEKHDYNSISWHGHINGRDGETYSVSFTRGESLTVGGMDTPDGHYVLQAHGDNGWLASSALLFKFDPDVPDVMYPHEEESGANHSH